MSKAYYPEEDLVVFRVRLRDASQTARSQVRFKLLKEIPKATSFRKTPLSPTLDVTGRSRPCPDTARLTSGKHWGTRPDV